MFIAFFAAADADVEVDVEVLLLLPLLLQAASASAAAVTAVTAIARPRVAGINLTAKLLCARSLGGGLADRPVSRVPARLTGFLMPDNRFAQRTNVRNTVT
jgi:hypothetical protein